MTTIYLIRHSACLKNINHKNNKDNLLEKNIKTPLSIEGEKLALNYSKSKEFTNIDLIYSSNYVRAISTAKYFAKKNNLEIIIDENLNERIHGVKDYKELPLDFEEKQMNDDNYKMPLGESKKEVQIRLYKALSSIINENKNKRIIIVGHSTSIAFLLSIWCKVEYNKPYKFNDKIFFDGNWNYLQTFKLEFDNDNLINIETINNE